MQNRPNLLVWGRAPSRGACRAALPLLAMLLAMTLCGAARGQTTLRAATFNASLNRDNAGQLVNDLKSPGSTINRIKQINTDAEIIQRIGPDVLLINEFDFVGPGGVDPVDANAPANLFQSNFLSVGKNTVGAGPAPPIQFAHRFSAPSNTGIPSGFDLDNSGTIVTTTGATGYGEDALGFGQYPGQYGMVLYSKFPIVADRVRTFQNFRWKDMPGSTLLDASLPRPLTTFYSPAERDVLRLSSKSHWDIPLNVNGTIVHVLAAHPTPPSFDGAEDRNGRRNHDGIRFWKDYVNGAAYIYDDNGRFGGLPPGERFIILGDYNADPNDGDSHNQAINQLLLDPLIQDPLPTSSGGPEQAARTGGVNSQHQSDPRYDTADFNDAGPGNLRIDYVLPSAFGLAVNDASVFWPLASEPTFGLVGTFGHPDYYAGYPSSDHRAVYVDLVVVPEPSSICLTLVAFLSLAGWLRLAGS